MSNPFAERKPWAAVPVTLVLGPAIAMAWLNRGWYALAYLLAQTLVVAAALASDPGWFRSNDIDLYLVANLIIWLAGIAHAVIIARRRDPAERMRWYSRWPAIVGFAALPIALALGIRVLLYQPFSSPGESMAPTLNVGDYFFVDKRAYHSAHPQRGDIVVFFALDHVAFVKRIAGVPGDRVQMKEGHLYLNGAEVPQRADGEMDIGPDYMGRRASVFVETLPDGRSYRILDLGYAPADNTEIFVVPPGHYFVLGDNRDNSNDSRNDIGFVSEDDIVGKVAILWFDGRTNAFAWRRVQ